MTSGFRRDVHEIWALLGYYVASSGQHIGPILKDQEIQEDFLTHEDGTDTLSQNVAKGLPL
jgi:hypothetical protein